MKQKLIRLDELRSALARLKEGLEEAKGRLQIDGVLQRFEFTYELTWKVMQEYAKYQGVRVASPRGAIRMAGDLGLVEDVEIWLHYLEERNKTTHVYSEQMANEIYKQLPGFVVVVDQLISAIDEKGTDLDEG